MISYLIKFFAVLFFLKLLPVPINLDILLVRGNDFMLDLVCSFFFVLLLKSAASCFPLIGLSFDHMDRLVSLFGQLDELACRIDELGFRWDTI